MLYKEGVRGRTWLYIGIDPGVKTGCGMWDSSKKQFRLVLTGTILSVMKHISSIVVQYPGEIYVRFDDARKSKMPASMQRAGMQAYQGIGSVKRDCSIWEEYLTSLNIPFEAVAPQSQRQKKLSAETFKVITKYEGLTSQHARDASMLVFGM